MRQKARHFLHLLLGALLGLLGFSSCVHILEGRVEYGQPHIDFRASGKVTDASGKGIEGIRVAVRQHRHYNNTANVIYDQNDWYVDDTLYTDSGGSYLLNRSAFSRPDDVTVVFEDIDGEEHGGQFAPKTVTPEIQQVKKGDKRWYNGGYAVEADVTLDKQ